jgi:hypothetical protein
MRVAFVPRSAEIQPTFWRFVYLSPLIIHSNPTNLLLISLSLFPFGSKDIEIRVTPLKLFSFRSGEWGFNYKDSSTFPPDGTSEGLIWECCDIFPDGTSEGLIGVPYQIWPGRPLSPVVSGALWITFFTDELWTSYSIGGLPHRWGVRISCSYM